MKKVQLQIDDGIIEIEVNNDPNRIFKFASRDINLFDKFLEFQGWLKNGAEEMINELEALKTVEFDDKSGEIKANEYEMNRLTKYGEYVNSKIDSLFGDGAHEAAFAGVNPVSPTKNGYLFLDFFNVITPVLTEAWDENGLLEKNSKSKNQFLAEAHLQKKARANNNNQRRNNKNRGKK